MINTKVFFLYTYLFLTLLVYLLVFDALHLSTLDCQRILLPSLSDFRSLSSLCAYPRHLYFDGLSCENTSFVIGARRINLRRHSRFSHLFGARCVFDAWPCASVLNLRQQLVRVYLDMYSRKKKFAHHIMKM